MSTELPEEMDYELLGDCCATCRFWDRANRNIVPTGGDPDVDSACRRFPPVFVHPTHNLGNALLQWSARSYAQPWTNDCDWCGEFQPRKAPTT